MTTRVLAFGMYFFLMSEQKDRGVTEKFVAFIMLDSSDLLELRQWSSYRMQNPGRPLHSDATITSEASRHSFLPLNHLAEFMQNSTRNLL